MFNNVATLSPARGLSPARQSSISPQMQAMDPTRKVCTFITDNFRGGLTGRDVGQLKIVNLAAFGLYRDPLY